jgi:hypothetical protein
MRTAGRWYLLLIAVVAGAVLGAQRAAAVDPLNPNAPCSVFDGRPCNPSFCGVYDPSPCVPIYPPFGEDRRLTIHTRAAQADGARAPQGPINTIGEMFAALRACWEPPPLRESLPGMQMSVRFSFKRSGELVAPPRVTYTRSDADPEVKRSYGRAIDAALERCTPMPFSKEMGGAIAGRPISIRFVDDRPSD